MLSADRTKHIAVKLGPGYYAYMPERHISKALFQPPNYAHGIRVDATTLLFSAGGVPLDARGNLVGANDLERQTEQVIANLTTILQEASLTVGNIIKTTIYVVSTVSEDLAKVWHVLESSGLANSTIASTLVGVSVLGYPGQLVEIEIIAAG